MCSAVQPVGAARAVPSALRAHPLEDTHERNAAIGHGRIHHLSSARVFRFVQRSHQAKEQQHCAATEVADEIQRWHWRATRLANAGQCARQRDVVDVVSRCQCQRSALTPACHATDDKSRVMFQEHVRAQTHAFDHTRAEAFDEEVGLLGERQRRAHILGPFEVERNRTSPAG